MTDKKPAQIQRRLPRAIVILDYVITMQQSDNLDDKDTIGALIDQLMLKVAQEARR